MTVKSFVKGVQGRVGGRYCSPPQPGRCTDCSGLVAEEYHEAEGVWISGDSHVIATMGTEVIGPLAPGDILLYDTMDGKEFRHGNAISHVGVYVGKDEAVHALNPSDGIIRGSVDTAYWRPRYRGARRLVFSTKTPKTLPAIPADDAPTVPKEDAALVTPAMAWRTLGNTDFASFRDALSRTVTVGRTPPPLAEARAVYDVLAPHGLTRIGAGMAWIERSNETNDADLRYYDRSLHNLWAVKNPDGSWARYPSYTAAALAWVERILGPTYADTTTIAEFIARYAPWSDGNNPAQYGQRLATQVNALPLVDAMPPAPGPGGQQPSQFTEWRIPGLPNPIKLPKEKRLEVDLTPIGRHRPGRVMITKGVTIHETANFGASAGARMHGDWQDSCTPGHPDGNVGVSAYVENNLVLLKIPVNEESIHSGDWRNQAHVSIEICVNAGRNAEQTEDTAMWFAAAILAGLGLTAANAAYPHTNGGHCPGIINREGRWSKVEAGIDERRLALMGAAPPPSQEEYAPAKAIPRTWDGTDWIRPEDNHRFMALSRVFVTRVTTAARQWAGANAPKVRRDLAPGEAFLSHYVTEGDDGEPWLVSQYGSRIKAEDCTPALVDLTLATRGMGIRSSHADGAYNDPYAGMDGSIPPDGAAMLSKEEFAAS